VGALPAAHVEANPENHSRSSGTTSVQFPAGFFPVRPAKASSFDSREAGSWWRRWRRVRQGLDGPGMPWQAARPFRSIVLG